MVALYSTGMHDFVVREIEVGYRVALAEDMEREGFGVWIDLSLVQYMRDREGCTCGSSCACCCVCDWDSEDESEASEKAVIRSPRYFS